MRLPVPIRTVKILKHTYTSIFILSSTITITFLLSSCSDQPPTILINGYNPRIHGNAAGNYYLSTSGSECFVECYSGAALYKITGDSISELTRSHFVGQGAGHFTINSRGDFLHVRDDCRLFSADGSSHGVSCRSIAEDSLPSIDYETAALSDTGLHVVAGYFDGGSSTSSFPFFQLFHWDGASLGPRIRFPNVAGRFQLVPTMSPGGNFLLRWRSLLPDSHSLLLGQCYTASGQPKSPVFVINSIGTTQQVAFAAATVDDDCNSTIAWSAWGDLADGFRGLWVSRFDGDGQLRSATMRLAGTNGGEAVSIFQDREIAIAWRAVDTSLPDLPGYAWLRKFSIDGTPRMDPTRVSELVIDSSPAVQLDPRGEALVVWEARVSWEKTVIYGQLFDDHGHKLSLDDLQGLPGVD